MLLVLLHILLILSAYIEYFSNNGGWPFSSFYSWMQVIGTFLLVSVIFIPIGAVSLFASRDVCFKFTVIYFYIVHHFISVCFTDKIPYVWQVVEIVDRYETDCIPQTSRNDKVGFIQSNQSKICQRTLRVSPLFSMHCFSIWNTKDHGLTIPSIYFRFQRIWSSRFMYITSSTISIKTIGGI